jgi:hypothetical protein
MWSLEWNAGRWTVGVLYVKGAVVSLELPCVSLTWWFESPEPDAPRTRRRLYCTHCGKESGIE